MSCWQVNQIVETQAGFVATGEAGKGPALVLAHGWPWSSFSWHRIIPALAQRFHLYWYDMPGYGRSSMAEQPTSLDVQGRVFAEMLKHWDLDQPRVLAHDFGGATTLRAHLIHGCEFERLTLLNVVAVSPWGSDFFDHVGRHIDAFTGLPPHIHSALVNAYIGGAVSSGIDAEDRAKLAEPWLTEEGRESFYRQFAQADERYTDEIMHLYNQIRCPVDILWGADDPWIPLDRGRHLHDLIPDSSFKELSNAGNLPQLETPEAIIRSI